MQEKTNKYLIVALLIGVIFHGTSIFFTLENTYDALIHLFFAEHYSTSWFEPWNYKWYTGFTVMGYPPLVHQTIGLLSLIGGLKFGMFTVAIIAVILFITGSYRFSLLITADRKAAGYAAILATLSSSFVETLHIFGQLPSIIGISILMHSLPEIYLWIKTGKYRYLITSISLIAVTVTSHHVTPIFGMIFFIFPLIGMVIMDHSRDKVSTMKEVTFKVFLQSFFKLFKYFLSFLQNYAFIKNSMAIHLFAFSKLSNGSGMNFVLGFLEIALGLKFLSIADQAYHWGILDREIYLAFWIVIFAFLGFYLIGKIRLPNDSPMEKVGVFRLLFSTYTVPARVVSRQVGHTQLREGTLYLKGDKKRPKDM